LAVRTDGSREKPWVARRARLIFGDDESGNREMRAHDEAWLGLAWAFGR